MDIKSYLLRPFPINIFKMKDFPETCKNKKIPLFILRAGCVIQYFAAFYELYWLIKCMLVLSVTPIPAILFLPVFVFSVLGISLQYFFFVGYIINFLIELNNIFIQMEEFEILQLFIFVLAIIQIYCYLKVRESLIQENNIEQVQKTQ